MEVMSDGKLTELVASAVGHTKTGKFGHIDHLFSFVIDHQEKRLFYNLQPSIYNVNKF